MPLVQALVVWLTWKLLVDSKALRNDDLPVRKGPAMDMMAIGFEMVFMKSRASEWTITLPRESMEISLIAFSLCFSAYFEYIYIFI